MSKTLQSVFPAVAAFHEAALKQFDADPVKAAISFYDCHASSLAKALSKDPSFDSFLFTVTKEDFRESLAGWLAADGYIESDRAEQCVVATRDLRRPSDVALKAACRTFSPVEINALAMDLASVAESCDGYRPAARMGM